MKLGISSPLSHENPAQWADTMRELGCEAVVFPLDYTASDQKIEEYASAARNAELVIAEVGVWCNPISLQDDVRKKAKERCIRQLQLADSLGAACCVNVAGSAAKRWDGACVENFTEEWWNRTVSSIQEIIDTAQPKNTYYTIEPMPWMIPANPDQYMKLLDDVGNEHFAVHMDIANWITSPEKFFYQEKFMQECFDNLGSLIKSCHIKDVCLQEEFTFQLKETACGKGKLNLEYYVELAEKINPQMPVIIEHLDTDEDYKNSVRYLKERLHK